MAPGNNPTEPEVPRHVRAVGEADVSPAPRRPAPSLGAKLGAIRCGRVWTGVDAGARGSLSFRRVWTPVDTRGRGLEIYGSEGWGFESLRAC
jgi:hypothetical protein